MKRWIAGLIVAAAFVLVAGSCGGLGSSNLLRILLSMQVPAGAKAWEVEAAAAWLFLEDADPNFAVFNVGPTIDGYISGSGVVRYYGIRTGYLPYTGQTTFVPGGTFTLGPVPLTLDSNLADNPLINSWGFSGAGAGLKKFTMCVIPNHANYWGFAAPFERSNPAQPRYVRQLQDDATVVCGGGAEGLSATGPEPTSVDGFHHVMFFGLNPNGLDSAFQTEFKVTNNSGSLVDRIEVATNMDPLNKGIDPPGGWSSSKECVTTSNTCTTAFSGGLVGLGGSVTLNGGGKGALRLNLGIDLYSAGNLVGAGPQVGAGNVTGRIVDSVTNAPIANATVTLHRGGQNYTATTDAQGKYTFTGLPVDNAVAGSTYKGDVQAANFNTQAISGQVLVGANDWGDTTLVHQ